MKVGGRLCRFCFGDLRGPCGCIDARDVRDVRQRAEIRDLKKRLVMARDLVDEDMRDGSNFDFLDLSKPLKHVCSTRSGDEQVTCDDKKCPRKVKR